MGILFFSLRPRDKHDSKKYPPSCPTVKSSIRATICHWGEKAGQEAAVAMQCQVSRHSESKKYDHKMMAKENS